MNKIALINNQAFSKQLLNVITNNQDTLDADIYQLSKFSLISNIDSNKDNPIFEMHDVIAQKISEINGEKNKGYLEEIVTKLVNVVPKMIIKGHVFRVAKTIQENLEIIGVNTVKYNVNVYKSMELNMQLMYQYLGALDLYSTKKLVNWFDQNERQDNFKSWLMNNEEKRAYANYLGLIGKYYRRLAKHDQAVGYYTKAKEAFNNIKGNESFKYDVFLCLGKSYLAVGKLQEAAENFYIAEQMFNSGSINKADVALLYFAKARLFFAQGQYLASLEQTNKSIEQIVESGIQPDDLYLTGQYLLKAEILNYLGKYQEGHDQVKRLYDIYKSSKKEDHATFGQIYSQLAISELGLGQQFEASEHVNKAISIFLADEVRNPKDEYYSEDPELALAYMVQGDIFFVKNKTKEAIESYRKAQGIYLHLYKDNIQNMAHVSELYLKGAQASCKAQDLYHYKCFGIPQINEFGRAHPNTIKMLEYCKSHNLDLWVEED